MRIPFPPVNGEDFEGSWECPNNGVLGGFENIYEVGDFSDAESDGGEVGNIAGIKYDYHDKT
jgi:hypothetical protein